MILKRKLYLYVRSHIFYPIQKQPPHSARSECLILLEFSLSYIGQMYDFYIIPYYIFYMQISNKGDPCTAQGSPLLLLVIANFYGAA